MKKNLLYGLAALSLAACTTAPATDYALEVSTRINNNGKMMYIMDYDDNMLKLDSAVIENGKAVFAGKVEEPRMVRINIDGKRGPMFILEAGKISIDSLGTASGSKLNETLEGYHATADSLRSEFAKLQQDTSANAKEQVEALIKAYYQLDSTTCAENKGNPVGFYMFIQNASSMDVEEIEKAIAEDSTLLKYKRVSKLVNLVKAKKATSKGNKYVDFEITYGDKAQKLSDFIGKDSYTIVDFWASWCGPCLHESKTLKKIYEKWNGKGLGILGVAVWDEPANTEAAIKEHKLPWNHIINGQNIPTDLYGIQGIPCIVVINAEGEIVARDVRGEDLIKFIDEKMAEVKK